MTDATTLSKAMAENYKNGKSNQRLLAYLLKSDRVPLGVNIEKRDGKLHATFTNSGNWA